uniref:Dynactin domain-containing protein n=1 Tax=Heterorhabditis bacteriophora TaxID=37862 RepID=A0A1I7X0B2_HETBA
MSVQEKMMDSYLELLRLGRFDENTSLDNLEKGVTYFKNVFSVHVGSDSFDTSEWVTRISRQILSGIAWCKMNAQRINFFLTPGSENSEVAEMMRYLGDEITQCEQLAIRTGKGVPSDRRLKLTSQVCATKILSILYNMLKLFVYKYLRKLRENLSQVLSALDENIMDTVLTEKKFNLRLDMAEARMDSVGKQDNVRVQHLEAKVEQLVSDNKKKQIFNFFIYIYIYITI